MWIYEKKLQYPVKIKCKDLRMAKYLVDQYGGPNGELSAAIQYLNQRYSMPTNKAKGLLTDIGTEELAHLEIIATMVYQLVKDATPEEMKEAGLGSQYSTNDNAIFPQSAAGIPWSAKYISATGDPVADLHSNMAAEQRARATYDHLIALSDDPGIDDALKFLRQREVIHFQRFGEALMDVQDHYNSKKYFY